MIGHVLDWVQKVDAGYLGQCSCGKRLTHTARESVDKLFENHLELSHLRDTLREATKGDT